MVDQIYSWFGLEDLIFMFSLFINFTLFFDYLDRKAKAKKLKRKRRILKCQEKNLYKI